MHRVAVVGTGYVGLVTGGCLADFGNRVICVDVDREKIEMLRQARVPFYEPGLEELVRRNLKEGRLSFATSLREGVKDSEAIFIAVGTPSDVSTGEADLSQVEAVAREVGSCMRNYQVVVLKSTVPTGTGGLVERLVRESQPRPVEFDVVSNPEFLREGSAIEDFMRPDRIIIGTESARATELMTAIYDPLRLLDVPLVKTDVLTSEMIKYASNAFLATKISFINEIANLCDRVGADVGVVARAVGMDRRIGIRFLHAGAGFGGSCFPKDTWALCRTAEQNGYPLRIVSAVIEVNQRQPLVMVEKAERILEGVAGKLIGILGLSFKPNTDDLREAPALAVARELLRRGAHVRGYDPVAAEGAQRLLPELELAGDPYELAADCHAVMVITEWNQFRELDLARVRDQMKTPVLIDCRNVYDPEKVKELGFRYEGVGRR